MIAIMKAKIVIKEVIRWWYGSIGYQKCQEL